MKTITEKPLANGKRRVTVDLSAGETLVSVREDAHYSMGEPMHEDVLSGHILAGARQVHWCSIEQRWVK